MPRRARDADATRHAILEAAQALFVERGFGSTSLAQIGARCNCTNSLILHHFDSKEQLWSAVKDRCFQEFLEEQRSLFAQDEVSLESLRETARAYFRLLQRNPQVVQLLVRAELERDLGCNRYDEERLAPFVEQMQRAQTAGLLRDDVPAAHLLLMMIHCITQWFESRHMFRDWSELQGEGVDDAYLDSLLKVFFEGATA
ncbi:MAG: TetR/AcrR family transcriptional regulator [Xanthomonadales bacterium]|nr:TetR/AcrR family transcriptional regulator [Xanthomonadales bacterium]